MKRTNTLVVALILNSIFITGAFAQDTKAPKVKKQTEKQEKTELAGRDQPASPKTASAVPEAVQELEQELVSAIEKVSPAFVVIGGGSGVVISPDGYMLTNHHVAGSRPVGSKWRVKLPDGKIYSAQMIGTDQLGDISLLKIKRNDGKPFVFVEMADSDKCRVGQWVIALGNPFGFAKDSTPTVTVGLISALNRNLGGYGDAIQTDAAINSGNSGGPLLDTKGRLVGINGMIYTRHMVKINSGAGFAISANQIKRFMSELKAGGEISHGRIFGLRVENSDSAKGVKVTSSSQDAKEAGIKEGDMIIGVGEIPVFTRQRFAGAVSTFPAGSEIKLIIKRGEETKEFTVKVSGPKPKNRSRLNGYLGARLKTVETKIGLVVNSVSEGSPAEKAGLKVNDLVTALDGQKIVNLDQMRDLLTGRRAGQKITLMLMRGDEELKIVVTLGQR